jgi:exopolysaccharide production protein ExoQ
VNERLRFPELLVLGGCAFVLSTAVVSLIVGGGSNSAEEGSIWGLIRSVSYLSVLLILLPYYRETLYVLRRNWLLLALLSLAFVSFLWTEMPAVTLRRSIAVSGTTLFGIALAVRLSLEDQLRFLSWLFRIMTVLSLTCIILLPRYCISGFAGHEWQGVFSYKNVFGSIMALSILVEWQLPAKTLLSRTLKQLALLLSAISLFFSGSITPMVALAGSLILIEMYKVAAQRLRVPLYATILAAVLMVSSAIMAFGVNTEAVAGVVGRSSDLTGRTEIWSSVVSSIFERPVLGYGYSGFWDSASASISLDHALGATLMYSHNGYLEILLNLGVVGFVLTLAFLGTGMRRAYYWSEDAQSRAGLWPLAFLLFFILHNFGECTIFFQDLQWSICVAVVASTDQVMFAPDPEQEDELLLEPSEELT